MMIPYATTEQLSELAETVRAFRQAFGAAGGRPEEATVAFGGPEEIIRVARRYEQARLTHFLAITNFGGLEHKKVLRSMGLMAKHVFPAFGSHELGRGAQLNR